MEPESIDGKAKGVAPPVADPMPRIPSLNAIHTVRGSGIYFSGEAGDPLICFFMI